MKLFTVPKNSHFPVKTPYTLKSKIQPAIVAVECQYLLTVFTWPDKCIPHFRIDPQSRFTVKINNFTPLTTKSADLLVLGPCPFPPFFIPSMYFRQSLSTRAIMNETSFFFFLILQPRHLSAAFAFDHETWSGNYHPIRRQIYSAGSRIECGRWY